MAAPHLFDLVRALSPDGAVAVASLGLLLLFVELNRPGRILPASFGLILLLLASGTLFRLGMQPAAALLLVAMVSVGLLNLYRSLPFWWLLLSTGGWILALRFLIRPRGSTFVHTWAALLCGGVLGIASALLTRIAYRARRAKALK